MGAWERGARHAAGSSTAEREGRRRLREERGEADNRAPRVRERREERRVAAGWAWPKKKQGARVGVSGPKAEREGEIPTSIYFFFIPNFPNTFSN